VIFKRAAAVCQTNLGKLLIKVKSDDFLLNGLEKINPTYLNTSKTPDLKLEFFHC